MMYYYIQARKVYHLGSSCESIGLHAIKLESKNYFYVLQDGNFPNLKTYEYFCLVLL